MVTHPHHGAISDRQFAGGGFKRPRDSAVAVRSTAPLSLVDTLNTSSDAVRTVRGLFHLLYRIQLGPHPAPWLRPDRHPRQVRLFEAADHVPGYAEVPAPGSGVAHRLCPCEYCQKRADGPDAPTMQAISRSKVRIPGAIKFLSPLCRLSLI